MNVKGLLCLAAALSLVSLAVENVLVASVKELDPADKAGLASSVTPDSRFPSSASIYYSVTRKP